MTTNKNHLPSRKVSWPRYWHCAAENWYEAASRMELFKGVLLGDEGQSNDSVLRKVWGGLQRNGTRGRNFRS